MRNMREHINCTNTMIDNFKHHVYGVFFVHFILLFLKQCSVYEKMQCRPFQIPISLQAISLLYSVHKKRQPLNIHEYSICFTVEKKFAPWDLRRVVIVFYRRYSI